MSIGALISRFGRTYYVHRPSITTHTDGTRRWNYDTGVSAITATGWFQPSGQSESPFEGRANSRTAGTIYFEGKLDILIEDEIYTVDVDGKTPVFRVTGLINPGLVGSSGAAPHLNMTVVDVLQVDPEETLLGP